MPSHIPTGSTVLNELTEIVRDLLHDPDLQLTLHATAEDVPGWDSMMHIAVIVEAECRFGVQFHTAEIEGLRNVGELVRSIEMKRARVAA